jgi:hypothetical protein
MMMVWATVCWERPRQSRAPAVRARTRRSVPTPPPPSPHFPASRRTCLPPPQVEQLQLKLREAPSAKAARSVLQPTQLNRVASLWHLQKEVELLERCTGGVDVLGSHTPCLRCVFACVRACVRVCVCCACVLACVCGGPTAWLRGVPAFCEPVKAQANRCRLDETDLFFVLPCANADSVTAFLFCAGRDSG